VFDENRVFIDPELYYEGEKRQINTLKEAIREIEEHKVSLLYGPDRSGKTLLAKKIQTELTERGTPTLLIGGRAFRTADFERVIRNARSEQLDSIDYPLSSTAVVIDDFEDCSLPDKIKERLVVFLTENLKHTIIFSFTTAPTVLYTSDALPDPTVFAIEPFSDDKIYKLVKYWRSIGGNDASLLPDSSILRSHEKVLLLFSQTESEKYPYNVVTFLQLLDSAIGSDIAPSSFAACYDALIQQRLMRLQVQPGQHDEHKNFLSLIAYRAYIENESGWISKDSLAECVDIFVDQFFSSATALKTASIKGFLVKDSNGYRFSEDYLWYFLCARYAGRTLPSHDRRRYNDFISHCADNIFQKKYANIIIYLAYFTDDNAVLQELMRILDKLFAKADSWTLSDKSRSIILGLANSDELSLSASADVEENRLLLMKEEIRDIVEDAEGVVARYTLPFLDPNIEDSELVDGIHHDGLDDDSYLKSVNALLRTHSVVGQILSSRSGTYGSGLVMECISKMVQASGRYASLNHAIATLLIYEPSIAHIQMGSVLRSETMTQEEKQKKIMRIFAFWSVYVSQTGLARYLSQDHSIRALERLANMYEDHRDEEGHYPFNFTSVLIIARLYASGKVDRPCIEAALQKYSKNSSLFAVLRAAVHIYSYYMPMTTQDKQWVSGQLGLPLKAIELQKLRAEKGKTLNRTGVLNINPASDKLSEDEG
jgi:hypothetical protein